MIKTKRLIDSINNNYSSSTIPNRDINDYYSSIYSIEYGWNIVDIAKMSYLVQNDSFYSKNSINMSKIRV